jgi:hypothetical protein
MEPLTLAAIGVGTLTNAVFQWIGMGKQAEENKKAREENRRMYAQQMGIETAQFERRQTLAEQMATSAEEQAKWTRKTTEKTMEEERADKMFNRKTQIMGGLTALLNSNQAMRSSLMGARSV